MTRLPRWILLSLLAMTLTGAVSALAVAKDGAKKKSGRHAVYTLPGATVYPEGIALDRRSGDFYVSSTTDGTIFKGNVGLPALAPWAVGGADGRTSATGMALDGGGRLFVAGAQTGKAFVLRTSDGSTLKALDSDPGSSPTFVNDVALAPGYAYFTDSLRPVILRVSRSGDTIGELEPWLDLTGTPLHYAAGFNANGIVSTAHGRLLIVVQSNTGKLFRIDTRRRSVSEIDLHGATMTHGDGLVLKGNRLYVLRNALNEIAEVKLLRDRRSGRVVRTIRSDTLRVPDDRRARRQAPARRQRPVRQAPDCQPGAAVHGLPHAARRS